MGDVLSYWSAEHTVKVGDVVGEAVGMGVGVRVGAGVTRVH